MSKNNRRQLVVHGHAVEIDCGLGEVRDLLGHWLGIFDAPIRPAGMKPARGGISAFEQADVLRGVSANAIACYHPEQPLDLYRDEEHYWLVDDRWGICRLNLLKRTWQSWVIEQPRMDSAQLFEWAVLWPMAQMLRGQGLHLLPAVGIERDGFAMLIIAAGEIGPELHALARSGYKIIGQRWIALRQEEDRIAMLQMPGMIARSADESRHPFRRSVAQVDLHGTYLGSGRHHAFCDAVILAGAGRRGPAGLHLLSGDEATGEVRRRWPIVELHPARSRGIAHQLAEICPIHSLRLSRDPRETVDLIGQLRHARRGGLSSQISTPRR